MRLLALPLLVGALGPGGGLLVPLRQRLRLERRAGKRKTITLRVRILKQNQRDNEVEHGTGHNG